MSTYGMAAKGNPNHHVVHAVKDGPRSLGRTVWVRWACGRSCSSAVVYPPGVVPPGKGCTSCEAALRARRAAPVDAEGVTRSAGRRPRPNAIALAFGLSPDPITTQESEADHGPHDRK